MTVNQQSGFECERKMREKVTTDHTEIRAWADRYDATPQLIPTFHEGSPVVGLRLDFPGEADEQDLSDARPPRDISWPEFFRLFEESGLAFGYYEDEPTGDPSNAYRFIKRELVNIRENPSG